MNGQRGFTLLEMLAALVLLAVCATVLLGAFGQSAQALQQSARSDRLNLAARSVLEALDDGPLFPGHQQGRWDEVQWSLEVTAVPAPAGPDQLLRLDLSLRGDGRQAHFSTLRVRSAGSGR